MEVGLAGRGWGGWGASTLPAPLLLGSGGCRTHTHPHTPSCLPGSRCLPAPVPCMGTGPALPLSGGAPAATRGAESAKRRAGPAGSAQAQRPQPRRLLRQNPGEPMIVGLHLFSWPFTKRLLRNVLTVGSGVWNPVTGVWRAGCGAGIPRAPRWWASQGRPWRAALHPEQGVLGRARKVPAPSASVTGRVRAQPRQEA